MIHPRLSALLSGEIFTQGVDGIYSGPMPFASHQDSERTLRERVAAERYDDYLAAVARSHSVPVMDHEVDRFLTLMPQGALILDVGGCWGWHWRRIARERPDVGVLIVDFVRANLAHARQVLTDLVGAQVALLHADATALPFPDGDGDLVGFDGVWTVQVFQHIPDFAAACREACRVLKSGGRFANYSLHATPVVQVVYRLLGRRFHTDGMVGKAFHLTRANDRQRDVVATLFQSVHDRYTECLFHPDLGLTFTGQPTSSIGRADARIASVPGLARLIARQRSYEGTKA